MGKIKLLLISVCFTISPQLVNSQFFVELNTGYAAPLYYTGKDTVYNQDYIHKYRYADTILQNVENIIWEMDLVWVLQWDI